MMFGKAENELEELITIAHSGPSAEYWKSFGYDARDNAEERAELQRDRLSLMLILLDGLAHEFVKDQVVSTLFRARTAIFKAYADGNLQISTKQQTNGNLGCHASWKNDSSVSDYVTTLQ